MITAKLLTDWGACWSTDQIAAHLAGRISISPREVAADETIDLDDRLWAIRRVIWHRNSSAAWTLAIDSARDAARDVATDAARGATESAAWAAVWVAAFGAAYNAEIRRVIARTLVALGPNADGW